MRQCVCGQKADTSKLHHLVHYGLQLQKVKSFHATHGQEMTTRHTKRGEQPVSWGELCCEAEAVYEALLKQPMSPRLRPLNRR